MLSKFIITDVGLAHASVATPTGPYVEIVGFKIGSGYGYTPLPADTGLTGTLLYEGDVFDYANIDAHTINIICKLPADAGPFDFGEIAIYLADGTMFAKAVYTTPQSKFTSLGTNVLSTYTFNCLLRLEQSVAVFNVGSSTMPEQPNLTFSPVVAAEGVSTTLAITSASSHISSAVSITTLYNDGTIDGPTVIGAIDTDGNFTHTVAAHWTGDRVSAVVTVSIDDMIFRTFTCASGTGVHVPVLPKVTVTPTAVLAGANSTLAVTHADDYVGKDVSTTILYSDGTMDAMTVVGVVDGSGNLTVVTPIIWASGVVSAILTAFIDGINFGTFTYVQGHPTIPEFFESDATWTSPFNGTIYISGIGRGGFGGPMGSTWDTGHDSGGGGAGGGCGQYQSRVPLVVTAGQVVPITIGPLVSFGSLVTFASGPTGPGSYRYGPSPTAGNGGQSGQGNAGGTGTAGNNGGAGPTGLSGGVGGAAGANGFTGDGYGSGLGGSRGATGSDGHPPGGGGGGGGGYNPPGHASVSGFAGCIYLEYV